MSNVIIKCIIQSNILNSIQTHLRSDLNNSIKLVSIIAASMLLRYFAFLGEGIWCRGEGASWYFFLLPKRGSGYFMLIVREGHIYNISFQTPNISPMVIQLPLFFSCLVRILSINTKFLSPLQFLLGVLSPPVKEKLTICCLTICKKKYISITIANCKK